MNQRVFLAVALVAFSACSKKSEVTNGDYVPQLEMNKPLTKYDGFGQPVAASESVSKFQLSPEVVESGDYVLYKNCYRNPGNSLVTGNSIKDILTCVEETKNCIAQGKENCGAGKAAFEYNDRVESLVGSEDVVRTLEQMEELGLKAASLPDTPWSDDYWALYRGVLGARYVDEEFPSSDDWKVNFEYAREANPVSSLLSREQDEFLSPSEKYDLLVGINPATDGSLTADMWNQGYEYYARTGSVERWMGICHGWAASAYKVPRPENPVTAVAAVDGRKLTFYPGDIKALASYLWATARTPSRFVGGRCNTKSPKTDEVGRVSDQECFDTNPGTWHMAVVNMIGQRGETFVLDATYDYEVWNQPIYSYSYSYKNLKTGTKTGSLEKAVVDLSEYTNDPFKKYRSPKAAKIVGIQMKLSYIVEVNPTQYNSKDAVRTVYYDYDLELDANGKIIGGEWYNNNHPDFLWTPTIKAARVFEDRDAVSAWTTDKKLPKDFRNAAVSAAYRGQVLGKIVDALVEASRKESAE